MFFKATLYSIFYLISFGKAAGYILREEDRVFLTVADENGETEYFKLRCFSCCNNEMEIAAVNNSINYFTFVESAKLGRVIDSNLKHWVQY